MTRDDNVMSALLRKGFGEDNDHLASNKRFTAPAEAMHVTVDIDQIRPYENNPRKAENEKFEEIKESIREIGLQQPFSITAKPGTEHYIIRSGGNTRLRALKELYQETGEAKFKKITCHYQPYTDDLELLSLHMMENEQRGKMLFIDISQAVKTFKEMYEINHTEVLSFRKLSEEMKKRGWSVHYPTIGFHLYAADISENLMTAFSTGLGRKLVSDIKKIEENVVQWAKDRNKDQDKCLQYFKNVLNENDTHAKDLNLRKIETDLYTRLSDQFKLSFNEIHNDFVIIKEHGSLHSAITEHDDAIMEDSIITLPQGNDGFSDIGHTASLGVNPVTTVNGPINTTLPQLTPQNVPIIPSSIQRGAKPDPLNRAKNELLDHFRWMIEQIDRFENVFVPSDDLYLYTIKNFPSEFNRNSERPFFDFDVLGVWHLIYYRLEVIRIVIDSKRNTMSAREKLTKLMNIEHLNQGYFVPGIISESFINNASSVLPTDLFNELCTMVIQPEIRQIFLMQSALDQKIQVYLTCIRQSN